MAQGPGPGGGTRYRIGIDTGGTFTDVVAIAEDTGEVYSTKTATTPADPAVGFMDGVRKIMAQVGFGPEQVAAISHGTTIATNVLLQEQFPGLALIVTRGFRNVLEIARQSVPQGYGNSYFWVKPERIVPLQHVYEVTERLSFRGEVLRPFDEAEAEAVAARCRDRDLACIGVCFLHSYANGDHERRMRDVLARVHPTAAVSLSCEVLPEYREYERAVTTLVDTFVKPRVARYVGEIRDEVSAALGPATPFYVMQSNGGVISAAEVAAQPITTILSGPAAGALGAAWLASARGFGRILTLDAGGTSTDVSLVEDGQPHLTTEGRVGRYPVKVPMIDVVTVGTGGGSIAWRAPDGGLKVGPRSAGAEPGPLCYGRGGAEPTITDAALVLGRIPPRLLGGEVPLDAALAARGIGDLAASLRLDLSRTAEGILEIAAWSQANAVRQVTVKRGLDVRDYLLVAFGGSGPLLAGKLVDLLGLRGALVPPNPGNVSAFGLLTVDLKSDYVLTLVQRDDRLDFARLDATYARLEEQARAALRRQGFAEGSAALVRSADLRYFGQSAELRAEVPPGPLGPDSAALVVERFHAAHERAYGYSYRRRAEASEPRTGGARQHVEWVNLRVTGVGPIARPSLRSLPPGDGDTRRALFGTRAVYFDGQRRETPLYERARLAPGDRLVGPAIVEEFGSTTVVFPGLAATVDAYGGLRLARESDR